TAVTANLMTGVATGEGTDTLLNLHSVVGSAKADILTGDGGANTLDGGAGDDTIEGGDGDDTIIGGLGIDTASYASGGAVTVDLSKVAVFQDTIGQGKDKISGFENLIGSAFNDTLTGDSKNNVIEGGAGDDILDGGAGIDTASYAGASAFVSVDLADTVTQHTQNAGIDSLMNFENLLGSAFNDKLYGNHLANVLTGGHGDDTLVGRGGADTLIGGVGMDTASYLASDVGVTVVLGTNGALSAAGKGGHAAGDKLAEIENINGSAFADRLTGNNLDNWLVGDDGDDIIAGLGGADKLSGGDGFDTLDYSASAAAVSINLFGIASGGDAQGDTFNGFEAVVASKFGDVIQGNAGSNSLVAGSGDDYVNGNDGADTMDGGEGIDTLSFDGATVGVTVTLGKPKLQTKGIGGWAEGDLIKNFENLSGGSGNDVLTGNDQSNIIKGYDGDDIIDGGLGNDILNGENGVDTVSYASMTAAVTVSLALQGSQQNTGAAGLDTLSNFENLTGGNGNDILRGDFQQNVIDGGAGDDLIEGRDGADTLVGGSNGAAGDTVTYQNSAAGVTVDLSIQNGATAQTSAGDADGDVLSGFEHLTGSNLDDTLTGDGNANKIAGGDGDDTIDGGDGADTLDGGIGNDAILGGGGADKITGGVGDDVLNGGAGIDTLDGGTGFDIASFAGAGAGVVATLGVNGKQTTVTAPAGSDGAGDKIINCEGLEGSSFGDTLTGNALSNVLIGGGGADTLTGGLGVDNFQFDAGSDGGDTITDFVQGTDRIVISGPGFGGTLDFYASGSQLASSFFVNGTVATVNGMGQFLWDDANAKLYWDDDGDGANTAQLIASFTAGTHLTAGDIWLL
ncbi:MAG: beta strand repeat-containing protein, partial [Pseudorhodoplanes sp.]